MKMSRSLWRFERAGEALEVGLTPRMRVDGARVVLAACRAGVGVSRLPEFLCARDLADGALVRLWPEWRIAAASAWALYSSRSDKNPTLHAFLDLLRARLRAAR